MWAPFEFEESTLCGGAMEIRDTQSRQSILSDSKDNSQDMIQRVEEDSTDDGKYAQAVALETSFKNVFASLEGDAPDFLQVLDIANEGYQQKEIHVVFECETKVYIY